MDANSLTDQLFDILEDLLIENRALLAAIREAKLHLPEAAQRELDRFVQQALSDSGTHEAVGRDVSQYKNQSLQTTIAQLRAEKRKKN